VNPISPHHLLPPRTRETATDRQSRQQNVFYCSFRWAYGEEKTTCSQASLNNGSLRAYSNVPGDGIAY
jgi:hypothetical protein